MRGLLCDKCSRGLGYFGDKAECLQAALAYLLCPTFRLGKIDDGKLQTAANLISQLVTGEVVQPGEPWIREYLGIPAAAAQTV